MDYSKIRSFYRKHAHLLISKDDWDIDPYAWDTPKSGIKLTPIESALWHDIRECGAVLYPQYPIGGYFADFANPAAKIVIECDGAEFHKHKSQQDQARQALLESWGWAVYRIAGVDCLDMRDAQSARGFIEPIARRHGIIFGACK